MWSRAVVLVVVGCPLEFSVFVLGAQLKCNLMFKLINRFCVLTIEMCVKSLRQFSRARMSFSGKSIIFYCVVKTVRGLCGKNVSEILYA